jgi:hypothetical protein
MTAIFFALLMSIDYSFLKNGDEPRRHGGHGEGIENVQCKMFNAK